MVQRESGGYYIGLPHSLSRWVWIGSSAVIPVYLIRHHRFCTSNPACGLRQSNMTATTPYTSLSGNCGMMVSLIRRCRRTKQRDADALLCDTSGRKASSTVPPSQLSSPPISHFVLARRLLFSLFLSRALALFNFFSALASGALFLTWQSQPAPTCFSYASRSNSVASLVRPTVPDHSVKLCFASGTRSSCHQAQEHILDSYRAWFK